MTNYCESLSSYSRRKTTTVKIGDLYMGSDYPIRVQSMTTIDTMDTKGSVEQSIRMIEAGCELVRITAPSVKEAQNLELIRKELKSRGYHTPLVADIHFTPNAAELAARLVEKVRINPGNYADKKRFENIDYTDSSYQAELERIREKFLPLIKICKEYGTAMRIGTNHGSLSDRILSRFGDTPNGMVESALEFLRICEDENYYNIVLSMKSSNTQVMVQAYRLLSKRLAEEGLKPYPLHLGVTEAGEGEDGRIKSAVGIGTLLEDGLGDTVRVSLTEDPEFEIPVAQTLVNRYYPKPSEISLDKTYQSKIHSPFKYQKRQSVECQNIGGLQVPRVIANYAQHSDWNKEDLKAIGHTYLPAIDKWGMSDQGADYVYTGTNPCTFMLPNGLKEIIDYSQWEQKENKERAFPYFRGIEILGDIQLSEIQNFLEIDLQTIQNQAIIDFVNANNNVVLIANALTKRPFVELRNLFFGLENLGIKNPVILKNDYPILAESDVQLFAGTDLGGLLIEGFGDGVMISQDISQSDQNYLATQKVMNSTSFGILQAARTRMSKTEYISCPSCGRTLFDLQETTAMIRKRTDHLKGIKIGIMGCIVNGPGEMADADYGYVGIGKDKISLYRGQEVIKRSVSASNALDELINLMKEDGIWHEPSTENEI